MMAGQLRQCRVICEDAGGTDEMASVVEDFDSPNAGSGLIGYCILK